MPRLEPIWRKYKDRGLAIVGVETHVFPNDLDDAKKFIAENGFSFPMLRNGERLGENDVAKTNRINVEHGLPTNLLIGADGKAVFIHHKYKPGDEEIFEREILLLLGEK